MENGNLTIESGTFTINGTSNAYGVEMLNGTLNITSGTFDATGSTAYGIKITNGTYTQGTYDGRGTDASDVSITDPHISANGTTLGIGMSMGNGMFKYYDGYLYGSTRAIKDGDIVSETETRYHVEYSNDNTSCTLQFDM